MIMLLKLLSFGIWLLIMLVIIIGGQNYALTDLSRSKVFLPKHQMDKSVK